MSPMLNTALSAARAAAQVINHAALNLDEVKIGIKGLQDMVTDIDQAAEEVIKNILLTAYPKHAFLGEESGQSGEAGSEYKWIVDPIDGTSNFIHGFPHYCISIALENTGKLEHALIYNPVNNDLYTATRGAGAFLNNRRIRVSSRMRLNDALLASAIPSRELKARPALLELQNRLRFNAAGMRYTGSAALDLAYVAAGYTDGFIGVGLKPWDLAAGALLVKEAGGLVTDLAGEGDFMSSGIVAATPKILPHLLKEIIIE